MGLCCSLIVCRAGVSLLCHSGSVTLCVALKVSLLCHGGRVTLRVARCVTLQVLLCVVTWCVTLDVSLCATLCVTLGWSWSESARGPMSQAHINHTHCRWRGSGWQPRRRAALPSLWAVVLYGRSRPPTKHRPARRCTDAATRVAALARRAAVHTGCCNARTSPSV